jgi:ligand-binding sensor domain-containing protein
MKQILFLVLMILSNSINAQKFLELYSSENSNISENDLKSILVDKKSNNKFIGTSKSGLLKFDNTVFEIIQEIKGEFFGPLYYDISGNIWVTATNPEELYLIKPNNEIEKINSKTLKEIDGIIAISEDEGGNIYFGGKGLVKFDGKNWSKIKLPDNTITIRTLDISADNSIAIGHNSGLIIGKENKWQSYNEDTDKLQLSTVRAVKFLNNNKLIVGYGGGFGNGGFSIKEGEKWTHFNKSNSKISDHMVRDIEIDKNNTLWMATNNGLVRFTENGELTSILFREGTYKNTILDISIDNDDVLWIATNFGVIKFKE